jgi:hypothetical protein
VPLGIAGAAAAAYSDLYAGKYLGAYQLAPGAVALLGVALAGNYCLRRLWPRWALNRAELLFVYAASALSVMFAGAGGEGTFLPSLVYPYYFANDTNRLKALVHPYTPSWLVPGHPQSAARWFFEGLPAGAALPWRDWVTPLLAWSVLLVALYGVMTALSLLVFDRWARHERLRFPLVEIPLALAGGSPGRDRRRLWAGAVLAASIGLAQGLRYSFPSFPEMSLRWLLPAPADLPWSAWGYTIINLLPAVIGLSYVISTDVCFTLVAFHMLFRLMNVAAASFGLPMDQEQDYWVWKEYQALMCFGGYAAYAVLTLAPVVRALRTPRGAAIAQAMAAADRRAVLLLAASLCAVAGWLMLAGMSLILAVAACAVYLIFAIVLARVVCEIGLFLIQPPILPTDVFPTLGLARQGADAALLSYVMPSVLFELRGFALPGMLQGMKLAEEARVPVRRFLLGILVAVPFAMVVAHVVHLRVFYHYGALQCANVWTAQAEASTGFVRMAGHAASTAGVHWSRVGWMTGGAALLVGLVQARRWLLWLPINPVGMVMAVSHPSNVLWASLTVGGLLKVLMLRYGGKRAHDAGRDVAIGLVLGQVGVTLFWYLFDMLTGTSARPLGLE